MKKPINYVLIVLTIIVICIKSISAQELVSRAELPTNYNELFAGSGNCLFCHNSQVNQQGDNIGIVTHWRSTMMANASKDIFWRAKVSHEGIVNPAHKQALEDVCTACHAPAGNKNAHHMGQQYYSINEMKNDPLALDGVQCTVCHQITEESMGSYSGNFMVNENKDIYGPFPEPFPNPMINNTGYTPMYSTHINNSLICASCHTLITNSVDNQGNPTGNTFVEQAIYQEWLNSDYPGNEITCQLCHIPRIDDPVKISSIPPWLEPESPFGMHHLAGSNVFMSQILKNNISELGITASETEFDSTIARSTNILKNQTMVLETNVLERSAELLKLDVTIKNIAGHKIPSGYPSRRIFIEQLVINSTGDTIFHSGKTDNNWDLIHEDSSFEPHKNIITNENEVQIYELVMGDINHQVTTVLERANFPLKDNRIPPSGFTSAHEVYDTVAIVGNAVSDDDFNISNGTEGTGIDIIHYHIPTLGATDELDLITKIYYQSVNNKWLQEMFSHNSDEIDLFKELFNNADKEPVLLAESTSSSIFTNMINKQQTGFTVYPNPTNEIINILSDKPITKIEIYNLSGELIYWENGTNNPDRLRVVTMPETMGIYLLHVESNSSNYSSKVIVQ